MKKGILSRKRTSWRCDSSDDIIANGIFSAYNPMKMLSRGNSATHATDTFVKCAGSGGEFVMLSDFRKRHICENCRDVCGHRAKYDMNMSTIDMVAPAQRYRTHSSVKVPCGCPHSPETDDPRLVHSAGGKARVVSMKNGIMTAPRLHSWRLTYDGKKLTLSLQYIAFFANVSTGKCREEAFYRHITADTETGQTYISNIHNGKHTYDRRAAYKTAIDTITYSGSPLNFLIEDKHCTDNVSELSSPLSAMLRALDGFLRAKGYIPVDTDRSSNVFSWRSQRHFSGFTGEESSPQDLIYDIARTNRFPHLPRYPFADRLAPIQMRRDADALPRDIRAGGLASRMGFDSALVSDALSQHPDQLLAAMILRSVGCDDPMAISYAIHHRLSDELLEASRVIASDDTMNHDVYDIVGLALASTMDEGGWDQLVRRLCDKELSCKELVLTYQRQLHDSDIPPLYPLHRRQVAKDPFGFKRSDFKSDDPDYRAAVLELTGNAEIAHVTQFHELESEFQKQGTRWRFCERADETTNDTRRVLSVNAKSSGEESVEVADVHLTCGCSLDRRKWNRATARKYADLVCDIRKASNAISPECKLSEFANATDEQQRTLSEKYAELVKMREKLSDAWSISTARLKKIIYKFDAMNNEKHKLALLTAISVWMERNGIQTTRETEAVLRPVKSQHDRRVKSHKAKKTRKSKKTKQV